MTINHKDIYLEFCKEAEVPIFMQQWWLDTACMTIGWDVILDIKNDAIRGAMIVFKKSKFGINYIVQPPFTFYSGIWFNPKMMPNDLILKGTFQREITTNIIQLLPKVHYLSLKLRSDLMDSLVFTWNNFTVHPMYTYRLFDIGNHNEIFKNYNDATKRKVKKNTANCTFQVSNDAELTATIWEKTFVRKGLKTPYSRIILQNLIAKSIEKGQGATLHLLDEENIVQAVSFIVWDNEMAYNITTAYTENSTVKNCSTIILHEAILYASKQVNVFDFEGSMLQGVEQLFKGFGGTLIPYFGIKKSKNIVLKLVNEIVNII
jgi:hypothetical protein